MKQERFPVPCLAGPFRTVYRPAPDVYRGRKTTRFTPGVRYDDWTVNDFSLLQDDGVFHLVGITHPTPPDFESDLIDIPDPHEAEHMLFHATAKGRTLADVWRDGSFTDEEKILYPADRPDEIPECHAPHLLRAEDGYRIVYGPCYMRMAETRDFCHFDRRLLFTDHPTARDPFLFREDDGRILFVYAVENRVEYRETRDMVHFSDAHLLQPDPFANEDGVTAASESPYLFKRDGIYYLMWAIYDGRCGSYDHRTYVFAARTIEGLTHSAPVAMLPAHAGEIHIDESGAWLLSVFYPENGVSAAPLKFEIL